MNREALELATGVVWYTSHLTAFENKVYYLRFDIGNDEYARVTHYVGDNTFFISPDSACYFSVDLDEVKKFIKKYTKFKVFK